MTKFHIDKGVEANRPSSGMAVEGHMYLTTDKGNAYFAPSDNGVLVPFNRSPYYLTSGTSAGTAAKTATMPDGEPLLLRVGTMVVVKFSASNTAMSPTLKITDGDGNVFGPTAIKQFGTTAVGNNASVSWNANEVVAFIYDGSYWLMLSHLPSAATDTLPGISPKPDWNAASGNAAEIRNKPSIKAGTGTDAIIENSSSNKAYGTRSHAEGYGNIGNGDSSHAEGYVTAANGLASHSEGRGSSTNVTGVTGGASGAPTTYITSAAHGLAVGDVVRTSGDGTFGQCIYAYVVSVPTTTSFVTSVTLGEFVTETTIIKLAGVAFQGYTHVEGRDCNAIGIYSHAEGQTNKSIGARSHSEGVGNIARNEAEHAQGKYNVSHTGSTTANNTIHSIGIGTTSNPKNAVEVMQNGDVYIDRVGNYNGSGTVKTLQQVLEDNRPVQSNWDETSDVSNAFIQNKPSVKAGTGENSIVEGHPNNIASGARSHAEGTSKAVGGNSHAEGSSFAFGSGSHSEGLGGCIQVKNNNTPVLATLVSGETNVYQTDIDHGLHIGDVISDTNVNNGMGNAQYSYVTSIVNSRQFVLQEGIGSLNSSPIYSILNAALKSGSHVEGYSNKAVGIASHAEGEGTIAYGDCSHAEGHGKAYGSASHAEGGETETKNVYEHAEGRYNVSHNGGTDAYRTRHSVGIGAGDAERENAFEIMANGDAYLHGVGDYDGTNPLNAKTLQEVIAAFHTDKQIELNVIVQLPVPNKCLCCLGKEDGGIPHLFPLAFLDKNNRKAIATAAHLLPSKLYYYDGEALTDTSAQGTGTLYKVKLHSSYNNVDIRWDSNGLNFSQSSVGNSPVAMPLYIPVEVETKYSLWSVLGGSDNPWYTGHGSEKLLFTESEVVEKSYYMRVGWINNSSSSDWYNIQLSEDNPIYLRTLDNNDNPIWIRYEEALLQNL